MIIYTQDKEKLIKQQKGTHQMKKRFLVNKNDLPQVLDQISKQQTKSKTFYNVTAKPYKGKKHQNDGDLLAVTIG